MTHLSAFEYGRKYLLMTGLLLAVLFQAVLFQAAHAEQAQSASDGLDPPPVDYSSVPQFGGPASVGAQIKSDAEVKHNPFRFEGLSRSLQPYFDFKNRVKKQHGFSFGGDYNMQYQDASKSMAEDNAGGGIFRLYGNWELTGKGSPNSGALVFKVENRHRLFTDIAPQQLASEIGYAGLTSIVYSDAGTLLTNLYWQQSFNNDHVAFLAGIVDTTDYVDLYGLADPWSYVSNLAFSTNPTIPVPNQGAGAALKWMLTDSLYLLGGLADANGDPSEPGDSIDSFFNDREYFKHIEFGWVPASGDHFKNNIHITLWQADERKQAQVAEGTGAALSFNKEINERWLPFLRLGYSDSGGGAFLDRSLSAGFGYFPAKRSDTFFFGVNWGRPSDKIYGPDPDNQFTSEMFYRFQLFQHMTVTPDIQYLKNPVLYPEKTTVWIVGLRARLVF